MFLRTPHRIPPASIAPADREPTREGDATPAPADLEAPALTPSVFDELEGMLGGVQGDEVAPWWTADPKLKVKVVDREDPDAESTIGVTPDAIDVDGPLGEIGVRDGETELGWRFGATPKGGDEPASDGVVAGGSVIYDSEVTSSEETDAKGNLIGRGREHSWRVGGGAKLGGAAGGVSGEYVVEDQASGWVGARADGTTPTDEEIDARIERIADRDAGESPEEVAAAVSALVADVASWEAGDSVGTDESSTTSIDARLGSKALSGSAGVSDTDRSLRTVESLGEGRVRVTLTQSDETEVDGGVSVAGVLGSVKGEAGRDQAATQSVELDLTTPQGQADFAILQYTGMLPGAAEALGIDTPEEAAAFLSLGGMEAVADGRWQVPDASAELVAGGKDALNAHLLEGAGADSRYVEVSDSDTTRTEARLGLAGFNLVNRDSERSHEVIRTIGPDGEEVVTRNEETVSWGGLFVEDGTSYAGSVIDADGSYVLRTASTYDDDVAESDTELAERIAANPELAEVADDPRTVTTIAGVTADLVEDLEAAEVDADLTRTSAYLWLQQIAGYERAPSRAIEEAAERAGLTVDELMAATDEALATLAHDPDAVTDLSPAVAEAYAVLAIESLGPAEGLDALGDIADHASPEATTAAVSAAIASGVEVTPALLSWAEEHGVDLGTITTEAVAGSSDAQAVLDAAVAGTSDLTAGAALIDGLTALTDDPGDLDLMLDGLAATTDLRDLLAALPPGMGSELVELGADHPGVRAAVTELLATDPAALLPRDLVGDELTAWIDQNLGDLVPEGLDADALVARARADVLGCIAPEVGAVLLESTGASDLESLFAGYGPAMVEDILQGLAHLDADGVADALEVQELLGLDFRQVFRSDRSR
ncbi:MAG: hypothetical protein H6738_24205 [Alphaproteobacteria bacterium]|nr:hypothetical protein [Alphaproteobacteria bacterium]